MLLRLSTLATGRTGVRPETARAYAALLDAGITPVVHEYGSLGCSGDLAPLSSVALALMGEGEVRDARRRRCAPPPRRCAPPASSRSQLAEKEGLALVNGTDGMLGMLVLALADLRRLLTHGRRRRRDERRGAARHRRRLRRRPAGPAPAPGPGRLGRQPAGAARRQRRSWPATAGPECTRVQDAYSLRCAPRCTAPPATPLEHAAAVAGRELAAAIDNPVVTLDGRVESNGNFHGAPVGYVLDFLAIAVADVAEHERAAHRPVPRRRPQQRAAAVPRRRRRASTPAT